MENEAYSSTSSSDFQTPSPFLQKALPYPPREPLRRKVRPLIELPEYGSPNYNKLGKWAHASDEKVLRFRREMRRRVKEARRQLRWKNQRDFAMHDNL